MRMKLLLTVALAAAGWGLVTLPVAMNANATEAAKASPEVIMYTTSTCSYCAKARTWFSSHDIAWDERDIESSADARQEWTQLGGKGTPLILINGNPVHGFSEAKIEAELAQDQ